MNEGKINTLPIKDYSERPRNVHSNVGEPTAIRLINPNDRVDMRRWKEMDAILGTMPDFYGKPLADRSLVDDVRSNQPGKTTKRTNRYMFAVAGIDRVSSGEIGEMQGCIGLYPKEDTQVNALIEKEFLPVDARKDGILEVSYIKKTDAPMGQMASGLRQVCTQVSQIEGLRYETDEHIKPVIYITANVKKEDEAAKRVLEASGFENKGGIVFYQGDEEYDFYVLNWEKLNTIVHEKADGTLRIKE